jgi:hypothetical protein
MRFYGIPTEERLARIVEAIEEGEWVFEDLKEGRKERIGASEAKERLRDLVAQIRKWKEEFSTVAKATVFAFVHDPDRPRAFKIYDPSSLGCSTELTPPRWKVYREDLEGRV